MYIGLLVPAHPPKVKYFMLLYLVLSACVYWPLSTSTPSQSEIFSQICYCSLSSLVVSSILSKPPVISRFYLHNLLILSTCPPGKCIAYFAIEIRKNWSVLIRPSHPPKCLICSYNWASCQISLSQYSHPYPCMYVSVVTHEQGPIGFSVLKIVGSGTRLQAEARC